MKGSFEIKKTNKFSHFGSWHDIIPRAVYLLMVTLEIGSIRGCCYDLYIAEINLIWCVPNAKLRVNAEKHAKFHVFLFSSILAILASYCNFSQNFA